MLKNKIRFKYLLIGIGLFSIILVPTLTSHYLSKNQDFDKINLKEETILNNDLNYREEAEIKINEFKEFVFNSFEEKPQILVSDFWFIYPGYENSMGIFQKIFDWKNFIKKMNKKNNDINNAGELFFKNFDSIFNKNFFKKFNVVYLIRDKNYFSEMNGLDSLNFKKNKIYLNYIKGEKILGRADMPKPAIDFDEEIYFAIIPKIPTNTKIELNIISDMGDYTNYRKNMPIKTFFKSELA
ncbi:hypothetical protein ACW95P_01935 [Candidatus Mycoplasma pogonae]